MGRADREGVLVTGPDALTYLQSQVSQDLRDVAVGESRWTLVLEPTGKVDVLARATRTGEEAWLLDTDAGYGDVLQSRLQRFKIRVKADIEPVELEEVDGPGDAEAERIRAAWPAMGAEIVPGETIPGELPHVVRLAVSFTKGCYPGQELVERMDSRGSTAPRLLRRVQLSGAAAAGSTLVVGGQEVGRLTSVAGTAGLAVVRRSVDVPAEAVVAEDPSITATLTAVD
jgi:tRNA-modifying protein YgfZ